MGALSLTVVLVCGGAALNLAGVLLLKHASETGSNFTAIAGCLGWAATALVFLKLLQSDEALPVVSILTSATGFLAVIVFGAVFYGEVLNSRQWWGVGVILLGLTLVGVPAK